MSFLLHFFVPLQLLSWSFYSFVFLGARKIGLYAPLCSIPIISSFSFLIIDCILGMKFVDFVWPRQN